MLGGNSACEGRIGNSDFFKQSSEEAEGAHDSKKRPFPVLAFVTGSEGRWCIIPMTLSPIMVNFRPSRI